MKTYAALLGVACLFLGFSTWAQEDAPSLLKAGIEKHQNGEDGEALVLLNKSIALDSLKAQSFNVRGMVRFDLKDHKGANADYSQAIRLDSNYSHAFYNRAINHYEHYKYEEALIDYDVAIDLDPYDADMFYNRGLVKEKLKDFKGAMEDYNQSIKINEDEGEAYHHRAKLLHRLGDDEAACTDMRKAHHLGVRHLHPNLRRLCGSDIAKEERQWLIQHEQELAQEAENKEAEK